MVYQKDKNFNLLCLHKFSLPQSPTLHLILNLGHYNLLVSSMDQSAQNKALENENRFLEDLRRRIANENQDFSSLWNFDQESYPDIGLDEFTGEDFQGTMTTTTTTTSITPESLMSTLFPEEEWSNIEDDGERASLPNASPQESTPDSSEEVQPTFRFTDSDFESFLHQKRQTLKGARTVRESEVLPNLGPRGSRVHFCLPFPGM